MDVVGKGQRHNAVVVAARLGFHSARLSRHVCEHFSYGDLAVQLKLIVAVRGPQLIDDQGLGLGRRCEPELGGLSIL